MNGHTPPQQGPPLVNPEPGKVAIRDPDGSVWKIPANQLAQAQSEGARPATEAEWHAHSGGIESNVDAAAIGALRGATFGLSDPAMIEGARLYGGDEGAEDVRRAMNLEREAHPVLSTSSEIAGALAPIFFFGGGPGMAGAGAAEGAEALGLGARALRAAPRLAAEGAAIGAAQQGSEDALGNHKLAAENYLTAAGKGSLIALLTGGALGAAGAGLGRLSSRAAEGTVAEEAALTRALGTEGEAAAARSPTLEWAGAKADELAFRGMTNAKKGDIARLGQTVEDQAARQQRIGKTLTELAEREKLGVAASPKAYADAVAKELKAAGSELGSVRAQFDKAQARPDLFKVGQAFNARAEELGIASRLYGAEELKPAQEWLTRMVEGKNGLRPTFKEMHAWSSELGQKLSSDYARLPGGARPTGAEGMRLLHASMLEELEGAGARASEQIGKPDLIARHALLNEKYADLKTAQKILSREVAGGQSRLPFGLSDIGFGTMAAAVTGHPAALVAPAIAKFGREYGRQIAASAIRKATQLETVQAAAQSMDRMLSKGAKEVLTKGTSKLPARKVTQTEVRELNRALASAPAVEARVNQALGDLPRIAPRTAAAATMTAMRAASYLRQNMPKESGPTGLPLVPKAPESIPDSELRRTAAMLEAIEEPEVLLERLKQGQLTQAHVDALKGVHPETFARMQYWIREHAAELRPTLTVQEEIELSLLFDQPLNEMMLPINIAAFQQVFAQPSSSFTSKDAFRGGVTGDKAAGQSAPQPNQPVALNAPTSVATGWDRISSGKE